MLNQIVLVGRLVRTPEVEVLDSGKRVSSITLAIPRCYKNADGEDQTDFIDCTLWDGVASNTSEYCKKGDIIGIKGRIETQIYDVNGESRKSFSIIAEKVTFLSSSKVNC